MSVTSSNLVTDDLNRILRAVPPSYRHEFGRLEAVVLHTGTVLQEADHEIDHVYFPSRGLVSLLSLDTDGASIEIGLIGSEGMVGVPVILGGISPHRAVVQMSGAALRMPSRLIVEQFHRNEHVNSLLLRYTNALMVQIGQHSICNCYHTIQERFCRWLLLARDGARSNTLHLTHDLVARLIGTRRASVTVAAGLLQRSGLIRMARGQIHILDDAGLESAACECYAIIRDSLQPLAPTS